MKSKDVVLCIFVIFIAYVTSEIVVIDDGPIEGTVMTSRLGRSFHAFLRIPYASPPVGELRFEAPQPLIPWAPNVYNGTFYGQMCIQPNGRPDLGVSEDCLHLNVFTNDLTASKPVIVYIHGGSFEIGSGTDQGGPNYLMDREVVVVNFNYRLGALGFLALETKEISGNAGLKDQVMVLQWIKKNIAKFGGDPDNVTVSGMSAGAVTATANMVSPMARDLFHRVIAISGSVTIQPPLETNNIEIVRKLAITLNCSDTENIQEIIKCLKAIENPLDIVSQDLRPFSECTIITWLMVIEPDLGQERYLNDDPIKLFSNGNYSKVPVIIGRTNDEFVDAVARIVESPTALNVLNENFYEFAPACFGYEANSEKSRRFSDALSKYYLPFSPIDVRSFGGLNQMISDGYIGWSVHRLVHLISDQVDVYYYKFSYVGRYSVFRYPRNQPYGIHHSDDIQYPFSVDYFGPYFTEDDPESFMVDRMSKIYESFATTGNPNYNENEIHWPKHNSSHEFYMDIGLHLIEKNGLFLERYAIWDEVEASSNTMMLSSLILILASFITLLGL
ncbi:CLUMA_CG001085, isoform A [Clunio marinus]|uniref:Carboxylic ester hydrolase n=1 Tax=Clunio marinus TaxID=568069 RepID=A0A1J1HHD0_9DIPT|nr:CLUMA_CG001085, isoform A [Clunio marinus]